jgi:hypothetical protein
LARLVELSRPIKGAKEWMGRLDKDKSVANIPGGLPFAWEMKKGFEAEEVVVEEEEENFAGFDEEEETEDEVADDNKEDDEEQDEEVVDSEVFSPFPFKKLGTEEVNPEKNDLLSLWLDGGEGWRGILVLGGGWFRLINRLFAMVSASISSFGLMGFRELLISAGGDWSHDDTDEVFLLLLPFKMDDPLVILAETERVEEEGGGGECSLALLFLKVSAIWERAERVFPEK